jgi:hypothetical protein
MKRILIAILAIMFIATPVKAKEKTLTFAWTPNTEVNMGYYELYSRDQGGVYDYDNPEEQIVCNIVGGKCITSTYDSATDTTEIDVDVTFTDGQLTTKQFVIRAVSNIDIPSADSNEVSLSVDLRPIASPVLTAVFNPVAKSIDFTWTQADVARVVKWTLYNSLASGGPYTVVDDITDTSTPHTYSWPINQPQGQKVDYYFVAVAFTDEVNSVDSNQVKVTVDTHGPARRTDLKVRIKG